MDRFGDLLSELRHDRKMTLKEVADVLFVTTQAVSNYEHGRHYPDAAGLIALADLFDVTVDYLLGRSRVQVSVEDLNEPILGNRTAAELIVEVKALSPARKQALATLLDDMRIGTAVDQN